MRQRYMPEITARSFDELPHTLVLPEIAALCSMSYAGATYWVRQGQLKARKAYGTWLVEKSDLLPFIEKKGITLRFSAIERAF